MVRHPILLCIFRIVEWSIVAVLLTPHIVRWWNKRKDSRKKDNPKDKES